MRVAAGNSFARVLNPRGGAYIYEFKETFVFTVEILLVLDYQNGNSFVWS